jgi:hypothetical protein
MFKNYELKIQTSEDQDVEGRPVLNLLNIVTSLQELILDLEEEGEY